MKKLIFTLFISMFVVSGNLLAQSVTLVPYGVSPREADADTTDIFDRAYNALANVGIQTQMYLKGSSDLTLSGQSWTLTSKPAASTLTGIDAATTIDTATEIVVFTPDVVGQYVVTFTSNGVSATININAGLYQGIADGGCGTCHSGKKAEWEGTGHSMHLKRGLNGTLSSHYSAACISCHTVGYDKNADNNGFDDRTFVFPDTLFPGMYDSMLVAYPDAMKLANIQCESCHGPGSEHHGNPADNRISFSNDVKVCAICHDEGTHHYFPSQWKLAKHANPTSYPTGAGRASCAQCHTPGGFVQFAEGQTVTENPGEPFGCTMCHDPHSNFGDNPVGGKRHQLRVVSDVTLGNGFVVKAGGNGKLCMNCHKSRRDAELYTGVDFHYSPHFGPHHGPQADMLAGTNVITFGQKLPSSPHLYATEDACVTCHMNKASDIDGSGFPTAGGHTFSMVYPDGTDNVAVCQTCHGDFGKEFADKKMYLNGTSDLDGNGTADGFEVELDGLMEQLAKMLPPLDSNAVDMSGKVYNNLTPTQIKAAYNYLFVKEDKSHGFHNPQFAVALLKVSMAALKLGQFGPGRISNVYDVPNDQGKQVNVSWTQFGGDNNGISDNPIVNYGIYRIDSTQSGSNVKNLPTVDQLSADNLVLGSQYALANGTILTNVGVVPAAGLLMYNAVVPTLYNAVKGDTVWTKFKVAGFAVNGNVAWSDVASGYSLDNLSPAAPTNVSGEPLESSIALTWDETLATDFSHYAVYRSETEGFDPATVTPVSTIVPAFTDNTVEINKKYYYRVSTIDFNSNESDYSEELNFEITDVAGETALPTKYSLSNNYPNPFNPSTQIKFAIPQSGNVRITIYNSLGKEVKVLKNENLNAGYYNVTWNANGFSSGIYFYEMKSNNFVQVRKMLLLK